MVLFYEKLMIWLEVTTQPQLKQFENSSVLEHVVLMVTECSLRAEKWGVRSVREWQVWSQDIALELGLEK